MSQRWHRSTEEAITKLTQLADEAERIKSSRRESADHMEWLSDTLDTTERIFGSGSRTYLSIANLKFSHQGQIRMGGPADPRGSWDPDYQRQIIERHHQVAYVEDLDSAIGFLRAGIRGINNNALAGVYTGEWRREGSKMEVANGTKSSDPDPTTVFVVHGRNSQARDATFSLLRALGLRPLEWNEAVRLTGKAAPYVGEIIEAGFQRAQAVVVLFTGDDEARLRKDYVRASDEPYEGELTRQPRPNVLIEAGMALAMNPTRTIIVEFGSLRPISDVAGRHTIRMNNDPQRRNDFVARLRTAGCTPETDGSDWLTIGDFTAD